MFIWNVIQITDIYNKWNVFGFIQVFNPDSTRNWVYTETTIIWLNF